MIKLRFLPACAAPLLFATLAMSEAVKIDLDTAKRFAIAHNFGIKALKHEIEAAQSRKSASASLLLPKLGLAGGMDAEISAQESASGPIGYAYGSFNLFNGFQNVNQRRVVDEDVKRAGIKLRQAEFSVGLEVEEVFHGYLFKKTLIELKAAAISTNGDHQKLVQESRRRGNVTETDVMEFQLKDATLQSDLVALKQELEDARSHLKRLLGEEVGTNIQPVGALQHQHVTGSLMDALNAIPTEATTIQAKSIDLAIAKHEQKISEGRWFPQLDLEVRSGFLPLRDRIEKTQAQTSISLIAKMDLYSGGGTYWETRERAANVQKMEAELKDALNETIRKVEMDFRHLKVIEARADLEKNNVDFARRYYQSVLAEYRQGIKNSSDLSNAADRLYETTARKTSLEFDFIKQRIDVEKLLGVPLKTETIR